MEPNLSYTFEEQMIKVEQYLANKSDVAYYFIYIFLINYPLQLKDLLTLKVSDYHYDANGDSIFLNSVEYPIPEVISYVFPKYIHSLNSNSYMFVTQKGTRIHSSAFSRLLKDISQKWNITNLNCTELRKIALEKKTPITLKHVIAKDEQRRVDFQLDRQITDIYEHLISVIEFSEDNCEYIKKQCPLFRHCYQLRKWIICITYYTGSQEILKKSIEYLLNRFSIYVLLVSKNNFPNKKGSRFSIQWY